MCTPGRSVRSADLGFGAFFTKFFEDFVLVCFWSCAVRSNRKGAEAGLFFTVCLLVFMVQPKCILAHEPEEGGKRTDTYLFRGAAALVFALTAT